VVLRSAARRNAAARIFALHSYIFVMSNIRIKTIKGKQYTYRQTSVRKGKKVKTISEYLGPLLWIPMAAMSPGRPGGFSGHRDAENQPPEPSKQL
jgi:hypothetical protein